MKIEGVDLCPCCYPTRLSAIVVRLMGIRQVFCPRCKREIIKHQGKLYIELESPKEEKDDTSTRTG